MIMEQEGVMVETHAVVSHSKWIEARQRFLAKEKELTRLRDEVSRERRALPWERVDKTYVFDGPNGKETLPDLFDGGSQLVVYHFMFGPDWDAGCPSCSLLADGFNGIVVHLLQRDVSFVVVSRAPFSTLEAYRKRMGWSFKWVSSSESDFNRDYYVMATPDEVARGEAYYNYVTQRPFGTELPGASVFYKDPAGRVFHTYSTYGRGLDALMVNYQFLDLVPKGRDEDGMQPHPQAWVRRHDEYGND
jgi:predicted dithiol-disulfide oxidoreductase (DUF899 family)